MDTDRRYEVHALKAFLLKAWFITSFVFGLNQLFAEDVQKISLPLIPDLQRADLYVVKLTAHPIALLVLVPGFNGNGSDWVTSPLWQEFARAHNLDLAGVSFASDGELLRKNRGYYYPSQGAGQLLLDGLHRAFNARVPLLLYGFSGGAHFTSGFLEWKPASVMGWCAYSAEWWNPPTDGASPPGIVACGDHDERNGASLLYFKQGRSRGKPWLWISVTKTEHAISAPLDEFVRHYFAALIDLKGSKKMGQWVDIDSNTEAVPSTSVTQPTLTGWLPDAKLVPEWQRINSM